MASVAQSSSAAQATVQEPTCHGAVVCWRRVYAAICNKRTGNAVFEPMFSKAAYWYLLTHSLGSVISLDGIATNNSAQFPVQAANAKTDDYQEYSLSYRTRLNPAVMKYVCKYNPKAILRFEDTGTILVPDVASWSMAAKKYKYYEVDTSDPKAADSDDGNSKEGENGSEGVTDRFWFPLLPASNCILVAASDGSSGSVSLNYGLKLLILPYTAAGGNWAVSTLIFRFGTKPSITTSGSWTGSHTCTAQKGTATRLMYQPPLTQLQAKVRAIYYDKWANKLDEEPTWKAWDPFKVISEAMPVFYCMNWKGTECGEAQSEYVDESGTKYLAQY